MNRPSWTTPLTLALLAATTLPAFAQEARPAATPPAKPTVVNAPRATVEISLIPRKVLFGNPSKAAARISPDGKRLAFLAPVDGVMNVWVGPANKIADAKPVTADKSRGIRQYSWAYTGSHILYLQDKGGDENWRVYSTDLDSGKTTDLTPFDGVAARIQETSEKFPEEILIAINNREPALHDVHRVNVRDGKMALVQQNEGYADFVTDSNFNVRMASKFNPDGSVSLFKATTADGKTTFEKYEDIPVEDANTTAVLGFDSTGNTLYFMDSRGRNTSALFSRDMTTGQTKLVSQNDKCDAGEVMTSPTTHQPQAILFDYAREEWNLVDKAILKDFEYLKKLNRTDNMRVSSRSLDDRWWTVTFDAADGPAKTYLLDRGDLTAAAPEKNATLLFVNRPELERRALCPMQDHVIRTRDGLDMVCYLTLPFGADRDNDGKPEKALPLVLNVHGGPWGRDSWGFDPEHQWLANRGYAVLSVNFRGSTGFGKRFINAGMLEWAGKMHDDLLDAVNWAVNQKIADPKEVAIYGGSYGGYATLVGMTFTPDVFACGVSVVGPSNLVTLLNSIPPYWAPMMEMFAKHVGDPRTEDGKKLLESRSPLNKVEKISRPLLIGQGANDPRVKKAESDQIVKSMQDHKIPVTYVLFPDEGHGFARPSNRMAFYAVTEAFLADHLGGRNEPIGSDFEGSSITVPVGAEGVRGLSEAIGTAGKK